MSLSVLAESFPLLPQEMYEQKRDVHLPSRHLTLRAQRRIEPNLMQMTTDDMITTNVDSIIDDRTDLMMQEMQDQYDELMEGD